MGAAVVARVIRKTPEPQPGPEGEVVYRVDRIPVRLRIRSHISELRPDGFRTPDVDVLDVTAWMRLSTEDIVDIEGREYKVTGARYFRGLCEARLISE